MAEVLRLAILGAGDLAKNIIQLAETASDFKTVALIDNDAYLHDPQGLTSNSIKDFSKLTEHSDTIPSPLAIKSFFDIHGDTIDAIVVAFDNIPEDFISHTAQQVAVQTFFHGVIVDARDYGHCYEKLSDLNEIFEDTRIVYITSTSTKADTNNETVLGYARHGWNKYKQARFGVIISNEISELVAKDLSVA